MWTNDQWNQSGWKVKKKTCPARETPGQNWTHAEIAQVSDQFIALEAADSAGLTSWE